MYVIIYIVYKYKCNYIIYNIVNQFHGGSKGTGLTKSSSYQSRFHEIETSHITSTQIASNNSNGNQIYFWNIVVCFPLGTMMFS